MSRPGRGWRFGQSGLKRFTWLTPLLLMLLLAGADGVWAATAPGPSPDLVTGVQGQARSQCVDLLVIGLRGHNDPLATDLGLGADTLALARRLEAQAVSRGMTFGTFGLPYTQERDPAGLPIAVPRDISPGAELLAAYLSTRSAACPTESRIVVGQSEGAAIVHWAFPQIAHWAVAAVLLGDALHVVSAGYNEPAAAGGQGQLSAWMGRGIGSLRAPDIPPGVGRSIRSYCLPHDQVCEWDPLDRHPDSHLDYRLNMPLWQAGPGVLDLAVAFIAARTAGLSAP